MKEQIGKISCNTGWD